MLAIICRLTSPNPKSNRCFTKCQYTTFHPDLLLKVDNVPVVITKTFGAICRFLSLSQHTVLPRERLSTAYFKLLTFKLG